MNLFYFIVGFILLVVLWAVPALSFAFLAKKIAGKKLSKGWCVFITAISASLSMIIEIVLFGTGKPGMEPQMLDLCVRFACLSLIFIILYDKNLPSILDSENELKEKQVKNESKEN